MAALEFTRRTLLGAAAVTPVLAMAQTARDPLGPLPPSWHQAEVIDLWGTLLPEKGFAPKPVPADSPPGFFRNVARPTLHRFPAAKPNGTSVLLTPGGGYSIIVGTHEGTDTAEALAARGYTCYVLIYRLPGEGWTHRQDVPLQDAQRAIRLIRARETSQRVVALGYSAGGHLAASLTTGYAESLYAPRDAADRLSARPDAAGLIYPVITSDPAFTHAGSVAQLLGPAPDAASLARRSPDRQVDAKTPPCFLVHALDDAAVPVENSLGMLAALRAAKVPAEAHLFQRGGHGFGLGSPGQPSADWPELFDRWLRAL
ncbi:alpha/beta hydrolase [Sphingomonas sp. HT-1]|uniref:alpha/beta hydrolase n=1 Tax=unclassified Sphingomonas TaxID=196159 RepID=UPI0002EB03C8|nr:MULTISPECIES: alpha/beta hydrolase [unclassified Sphingomonas]KTF70159.1 esterase [Sphingomonas sp. WG]